jgi:hypothetical protein
MLLTVPSTLAIVPNCFGTHSSLLFSLFFCWDYFMKLPDEVCLICKQFIVGAHLCGSTY